MSRTLSKPLAKNYEVDDWSVSFWQLTEGDFIELGDLEGKRDVLFERDGSFAGYREYRNKRKSERTGIYRTMGECSLLWKTTEGEEESIFPTKDGWVKKAMTQQKFFDAWDLLPPDIADAIVEKFYEHNPTLGTTGE